MRERYLDSLQITRRTLLAGSIVSALPLAADCRRTSSAVQGPYYRSDAPFTTDLRRGGGEDISVEGVVRGRDCRPLPDALIEIWQADEKGRYDVDYGQGTFLRARLRTSSRGEYQFQTIRPAPYGVGGFLRPAHIHFIVSAEGHRRLVTQLYFAGDPHLDSDPLRSVRPDLIAALSRGRCRFDVTLA
jgi:hydroxyquinol 1,2-dioxygenase